MAAVRACKGTAKEGVVSGLRRMSSLVWMDEMRRIKRRMLEMDLAQRTRGQKGRGWIER